MRNHKTVLIGGGTGMIGTRLSQILSESGYEVLHLSRTRDLSATFPQFEWDLHKGTINEAAVERAEYVINLAGAGIADGRWTDERKRVIIESRTKSNELLLKTFQKLGKKPKAYVSSAGSGIYGDTGEKLMKETDPPGEGFIPKSCIQWENSIKEVATTGVRTVAMRMGIVLSTRGGALERFLQPLNFFAAAYFGDGQQWYSWIHIDDACRMFQYALENEHLEGFYNAVAPNPVRNKEFTAVIVEASGKPALTLPAPEFALRLVFGEMADTILNSNKISCEKIQKAGFEFQYPALQHALRDLLKRKI